MARRRIIRSLARRAWRSWWRLSRALPVPQAGHGPPPLLPARPGPLEGKRVLVVVPPTGVGRADLAELLARFAELGARVGIGCETPWEARDETRHPIPVHRLLVEVDPAEWDALVYAAGEGAPRMALDEECLSLARTFAARGRPVAALRQAVAVLDRAHARGLREADPETLADAIASAILDESWQESARRPL